MAKKQKVTIKSPEDFDPEEREKIRRIIINVLPLVDFSKYVLQSCTDFEKHHDHANSFIRQRLPKSDDRDNKYTKWALQLLAVVDEFHKFFKEFESFLHDNHEFDNKSIPKLTAIMDKKYIKKDKFKLLDKLFEDSNKLIEVSKNFTQQFEDILNKLKAIEAMISRDVN